MAYTPKAGSLSLFKNDRKEKDSHPDYKGDGLDLNGNAVWVSAWIKEGKSGKFLSLSLQPKEQQVRQKESDYNPPASKNLPPDTRQGRQAPMLDDDLDSVPF
jgi:hypothetical protein